MSVEPCCSSPGMPAKTLREPLCAILYGSHHLTSNCPCSAGCTIPLFGSGSGWGGGDMGFSIGVACVNGIFEVNAAGPSDCGGVTGYKIGGGGPNCSPSATGISWAVEGSNCCGSVPGEADGFALDIDACPPIHPPGKKPPVCPSVYNPRWGWGGGGPGGGPGGGGPAGGQRGGRGGPGVASAADSAANGGGSGSFFGGGNCAGGSCGAPSGSPGCTPNPPNRPVSCGPALDQAQWFFPNTPSGGGNGPSFPGNVGKLGVGHFTGAPLRYSTGEIMIEEDDLGAAGLGFPWGHVRTFTNRLTMAANFGNGFNWQVAQWPLLLRAGDALDDGNTYVAILGIANHTLWFQELGNDTYAAAFDGMQTLTLDRDAFLFTLSNPDGGTAEFDADTGQFRKYTSPGGHTVEVTALTSGGFQIAEMKRTYTDGSDTIVETLSYDYTEPGDIVLDTLTLTRKVNQEATVNVRRVVYDYYESNAPNGQYNDLKTATTQLWENNQWNDTGTSYYRYHRSPIASSSSSSGSSTAPSSSSSGPLPTPVPERHLLKYRLNPAAFARLENDPDVTDPFTASDAIVAQYADQYFEYDDDNRVTKEIIQGGTSTYLYEYAASSFADGYNNWQDKVTETRPDGVKQIVYSNYAGYPMLLVMQDGTDEWCYFYKYGALGLATLVAEPSAISGYDEQYADLLHEVNGNYEFLKDSDGLITNFTYHSATGWLASESVQKGETGSAVMIAERTFVEHTPSSGSSSSSSSSSAGGAGSCWMVASDTVYPSDTDQTKKIVTTYDYTWYDNTCQVQQITTTLPVIPTGQNGSGVAATRKSYFDAAGNSTWDMDERGYIERMAYDIATGATTQLVQDADTSQYSDSPPGWTTPSGGGLNLVTDFEIDDLGRTTQSLGPSHSIDIDGTATTVRRAQWIVYDIGEDTDEIRAGQGYATGPAGEYTYTLINPVSVTKSTKNGHVTDQIQATRASTAGKLLPTDTFAQSSYVRWTTLQYTDCCHMESRRVYHTIPASGPGSSGTNYDQTDYGYDVMKRLNRTVTPGGTITFPVYNTRGFAESVYVGTDDTGATSSDPTGGGAPGNNMVLVTESQYDSSNGGGDGNLTRQTQYVTSADTRVTAFTYDFRNRQTDTDGEIDFYQKEYYDNLDRVTKTERYDTTSTGNLIARSETKFDDRNRVYQSVRYGVDPATGTVGNSLTDNTWYDATGNVIKQLPAGSDLFTKTEYDSLSRPTTSYTGYDLDESSYADAGSVVGDTILEQSESTYDDASNVTAVTSRQRYHDAPASQTGELKNPSETPKARVMYQAAWQDPLGRSIAAADYGTNGGSSLTRPSTVPERSDDVLVSSTEYDDAGSTENSTDPAGLVTEFAYDDSGRETERVMNPVSAGSSSSSSGGCPQSADENVTVKTAYNADGNVSSITAENTETGDQKTDYVYGTTLSDSGIAASTLKRAEVYPDSVDASDRITFEYNRQQEVAEMTDQGGTIHAYDYDKLGRQTQDRVIDLDTGVDGAVRRIATTYEVRGMKEKLTSYDNATVGSGSVVNEVQFAYNAFSQLTHDYQSHAGAVSTSTTPKVHYGYANGSANTIRPTSLTYPDGREIAYDYGTADGINDAASRIEAIVDDDVSSTHLADYEYLGTGTFVEVDYTEPDIRYTLIGTASGNDPDTGDIYHGFDRFGRIKDSYWYDYGGSSDVDRIKYGYDRASNRTWRQNEVARSLNKDFDELYSYDAIHRLKDMQRGKLNGSQTAITNLTFAQCWSLDETGNWSKFREDDNGDSSWNLIQNRSANKVNEINDITETTGPNWVTPAYSKAGNMTTVPQPADPTNSYDCAYDAWNRLVKVADGANTVSEYEYDGARRRLINKPYTGGTLDETQHLYYTEPSQWQVIEQRIDSETDPKEQHVWGLRHIDDLVLRDRDTDDNGTLDERLYAMQDANSNVTGITDTSGTVQQRTAYQAYGTAEFLAAGFAAGNNSKDWNVLYVGYQWDYMIRTYHVRNRVLNTYVGTWSQRDPDVYQDGMNLYRYVDNNPLTYRDPSGLQWGTGGWELRCYKRCRFPVKPTRRKTCQEIAWEAADRHPNGRNAYGGAYRHCVAACCLTRRYALLGVGLIEAWDICFEDPEKPDSVSDMLGENVGIAVAKRSGSCADLCLKYYPKRQTEFDPPKKPRTR